MYVLGTRVKRPCASVTTSKENSSMKARRPMAAPVQFSTMASTDRNWGWPMEKVIRGVCA